MRTWLLPIVFVLCGFLPSNTMPPAPPDPYMLTDLSIGVAGYQSLTGKTQQFPTVDRTHDVFLIVAGEGNAGTMNTDKYSPSNVGRVFNLNPYDGAIYDGADPWLGSSALCILLGGTGFEGCETGGWVGQLADAIIAGGFVNNVFVIPIAEYGSKVADWDTGVLSTRVAVAVRRITAFAQYFSCGGDPCAVNIFLLWGQGESDHGTAQADYTTALTNVITAGRAALPVGIGQFMPVFVAQETWASGATDTDVRAAQAAVINHSDGQGGVWEGPDSDTLNNTYRLSDGIGTDQTYWTGNSGTDGAGQYTTKWVTALRAAGIFPF